jgi:putative SOS response-associated peptidase YedK
MFKDAFAQRRCLVPAPAYNEWRNDPDGKTPFAVSRVDGEPVAFGETEGDPISLLRSARENVLRFWPVGKAVGNVRNDGPQLLEPIAEVEPTLL